MDNLLEVQRMLRSQGILISFSGRFSQEIIEELGEAVKKYLETESLPQNQTFNVFSVFIEQTQNIKNYSSSRANYPQADEIATSGIVTIGKSNSGYFVSSGNLIDKQDGVRLLARLEILARMDKVELKKQYKEQMKKDVAPGSTGAGLGLIDMARKSSRPLEFSVVEQARDLAFVTLRVYV